MKVLMLIGSLLVGTPVFAVSRALNIAATGMATQEQFVDTISNNIANVNTTGFKRGRAESEDLLYSTKVEAGARSSMNSQYNVGLQFGSGSKISAVSKEFNQGMPQLTNNPFDLMINGSGFFGIILPNNELRFTRDGSFNVSAQGELVNRNGYKVFPGVSFPPNTLSVNISEAGDVEAFIKDQMEPNKLATIPVFTFINPVGLKSAGANLFQVTTSSGEATQQIASNGNAGSIQQGALEASNVNIMTEMTTLIKAQRGYELNSKVMGIADQMMSTTNNVLR